ncbi:hypothetical protein D3C79_740900 [compost metagenome]
MALVHPQQPGRHQLRPVPGCCRRSAHPRAMATVGGPSRHGDARGPDPQRQRPEPEPARRRPADHRGAPAGLAGLPRGAAGCRLQPVRARQPGVRQPAYPPALPVAQPPGPGAPAGAGQRRPAGAQGNPGARPVRPGCLRQPAPVGHRRRWHPGADQPGAAPHRRWQAGAAVPVRLRRLRRKPRPVVFPRPPEPARTRRGLCHRPRAWRRRAG